MNKTPWFNAFTQSPVRDGFYEFKCPIWVPLEDESVTPMPRWHRGAWVVDGKRWVACGLCRWRGLEK